MNRSTFYTQLNTALELFNSFQHGHTTEAALTQALKQAELPSYLPAIRALVNARVSLASSDFVQNILKLEMLREQAWWAYMQNFIERATSALKDFCDDGLLPETRKEGFAERHGLSEAEAKWLMAHNSLWIERTFLEPMALQAKFLAI